MTLGAATAEWTARDELEYLALERGLTQVEPLSRYIGRVNPRFPPPPHLTPITDLIEESRVRPLWAVVNLPPRHRKLVADSTPVLTPDGWRRHGDLRVGDQVYAPDGTPTRILHVTPKDLATLEVEFSDGERIRVNPEHRWEVRDRRSHTWRVVETGDLLREGLSYGVCANGDPRHRWLLRQPAPVAGVEIELPIDPYIFGLWLGDGSTGNGRITASAGDAELFMAAARQRGYQIGAVQVHKETGVVTFCVLGMRVRSVAGRYGKAIPDVYYRASERQRRELLQGLVDSDGSIDQRTGRVRFVNTDLALAEQVARLVASLGYRVTTENRAPSTSQHRGPGGEPIVGTKPSQAVCWTPTDGAQQARLPRKDHRHRAIQRRRSIVAIRPCIAEPGHCIQVDHPSSLYLVGARCVPTHNTTTLLNGIAWMLTYEPSLVHAYATYNQRQASKKAKLCREIARRAGCQLDPRYAAAHDWRIVHNGQTAGGLYATGVGGSLTGEGITGLFLADDLIKNRKEAESEQRREDLWDWFCEIALTRMEPGASFILTMTRWHEDDPAGRLLSGKIEEAAKEAGKIVPKIRQIVMPALCEDVNDGTGRQLGEALWPAQKSEVDLHAARIINPWSFEALYQQNPRPKGGKLFHGEPGRFPLAEMMRRGAEGLRACIACDPAASERDKANHWATGVLFAEGYGAEMREWLIDLLYFRSDPIDGGIKLFDFWKLWQLPIVIEGGSVGAGPIAQLRRMRPDIPIYVQPTTHSKWVNAQPCAALWNRQAFNVPFEAPWALTVIRQCQKFTGLEGGDDDIVDMMSHGTNFLADAVFDMPADTYGARPLRL